MVAKTPRLLSPEQSDAFVRIPDDLSERDLGRCYTLSAREPTQDRLGLDGAQPQAVAYLTISSYCSRMGPWLMGRRLG